MNDYEILNTTTVIDYLKRHQETQDYFPEEQELVAQEVGDGNLNLVFIVHPKSAPEPSILVKQALPYVRLVGDSWPLTPDRARFEGQALALYQRLTPDLAPKHYLYDEAMNLNVMEHLGEHLILRKGLIAGNYYPSVARHLGTFIARTLFFTSDFAMNPHEKKAQQKMFINPALCEITEDLVFTEPYEEGVERNRWNHLLDPQVHALRSNVGMKAEMAQLKHAFMTSAEALIHGDLHTGSVMVSKTDTRVIDPEFAFYGPMGFDIGAIIANVYLSYASHMVRTREPEAREAYQDWLLGVAEEIWTVFAQEFGALLIEHAEGISWKNPLFQRHYLQKLLSDSAGFAAAKMMRRVLGLAHVEDLDGIEDPNEQAYAMSLALNIAQLLILGRRQFSSIMDLNDIVRHAKSSYPMPSSLST